jgi:glycine cleavage system regulatory protein
MPEELKIDVAGAEAAMAAAGVNPMEGTGPVDPFARTPDGKFAAPAAAPEAPAPVADAPEPTDAPDKPAPAAPEEVGSFTHIDDAAILAGKVTPEMMLQLKKSLQADYTTKTMEAAPFRKLASDAGMSAEDLQNATLLYQRLQDPSNLPQFQQELSTYMQQHGMDVVDANRQSATLTSQIAPAEELDAPEYDDQDPALAQLTAVLREQQKQIEALTGTVTAAKQEQERQAEWTAVATRLTSEENTIRAANPGYADADIEDIYSLMGPEGDLLGAQRRYESMVGARLARYLGTKEAAHATTPTPAPGGGVLPVQTAEKLTPDQAHAAALRHVAGLDALDAQ